jgi:Phage gp6-like head-tail connector protein
MAYATLAIAKAHLRVTDTAHDTDIQLKLDQAEAIITNYIVAGRTRRDDTSVPAEGTAEGSIIQSAILELVTGLYEHRGDDFGINQPDEELWNAIRRKLARLRDPALA